MKFAMTDEEIIRSYKNAENYKDQVRILAELNAVPVQDMARKMKDLGLDVDMRWYAQAPEKKPDDTKKLNDEVKRLHAELEKQKEINRNLGELLQAAQLRADRAEARVDEASRLRRVIRILMEEEV